MVGFRVDTLGVEGGLKQEGEVAGNVDEQVGARGEELDRAVVLVETFLLTLLGLILLVLLEVILFKLLGIILYQTLPHTCKVSKSFTVDQCIH